MTLQEKWYSSGKLRLLGAAALNALFLAALLAFIAPAFESNDDLALAAFVDGQMAEKCAHIPYINYALALLLKAIYTVFGESVAWHTIGQYALLFAGFTAMSRVLFDRLRFWQGALVSIVLLLFFGVDCYTIINYTKTASVATVGGLMLMLHTRERGGKKQWLPIALGIILALFGFMLRYMEFLPCAALMAVLGLRWLYGLFTEKGGEKKFRRLVAYIAPFALLLALCAGLYSFDKAAWSGGDWGEYKAFDDSRIALTDYGIPPYEDIPEQYAALDLNENAVGLFREGNFWDPDKFGKDTIEQLSLARSEINPAPSLGECLGKLLDNCITGFFVNLPIYGLLLIALLWLAAGEHNVRGWLTVLCGFGMFALFYMYLIWRGRYMIDRVDLGLFLALAAILSYTLKKDRLNDERFLSLLTLALALALSFFLCRDRYRFGEHSAVEDHSADRAAVETLLEDEEHLFLAKLDTISDMIYSPLEPADAGYWDKIILMGGWDLGNPAVKATMAKYGVENPYRDIVGNERVYMIEDDIDSTLEYIHDYYDEDATAELVEPLSSETGLSIYKILDGEA